MFDCVAVASSYNLPVAASGLEGAATFLLPGTTDPSGLVPCGARPDGGSSGVRSLSGCVSVVTVGDDSPAFRKTWALETRCRPATSIPRLSWSSPCVSMSESDAPVLCDHCWRASSGRSERLVTADCPSALANQRSHVSCGLSSVAVKRTGCDAWQLKLSSDQLRAASLIGRNAVT